MARTSRASNGSLILAVLLTGCGGDAVFDVAPPLEPSVTLECPATVNVPAVVGPPTHSILLTYETANVPGIVALTSSNVDVVEFPSNFPNLARFEYTAPKGSGSIPFWTWNIGVAFVEVDVRAIDPDHPTLACTIEAV